LISGIVLAAGSSSRLGHPKQLLDLQGKPMLRHVVDAALASALEEVVVVVGHAAADVRAALPTDDRLRTVDNPRYADGQSMSLIAGLDAVDARGEAIVVLLGDQPGVRSRAIDAVVERYRHEPATIVQASYSGTPAHPTLIDRALWPELRALTGDEGARAVIRRHRNERVVVELGGRPPVDIDTESDYRRVLVERSLDR